MPRIDQCGSKWPSTPTRKSSDTRVQFDGLAGTEGVSGLSAWSVEGGLAVVWTVLDGVRNDLRYDIYQAPPGRPLQSVLNDGPRSLLPRTGHASKGAEGRPQ